MDKQFHIEMKENDLELSKETLKAIETARIRIEKGHFVSEKEAKKRLGFIK
jgi:hypothetical protein